VPEDCPYGVFCIGLPGDGLSSCETKFELPGGSEFLECFWDAEVDGAFVAYKIPYKEQSLCEVRVLVEEEITLVERRWEYIGTLHGGRYHVFWTDKSRDPL